MAFQTVDHLRIEALPGFRFHLPQCILPGQPGTVGAIGGESIEAIDDGEDSSADGNLFTPESDGVTAPIPLLVVGPDNGHYRIGEIDAFQNLCADHGMDLDLFEFLWCQLAGFRD